MEIAERIGKTAFNFNLIFSLVITVIGIALLSNGINPGDKVTGLFIPLDWVYQKTAQIQQNLPADYTPLDVLQALGMTGLFGIFLEFLFMMISGFLVLVYTISTVIPSQLLYLTVPLYFIGAFVQLMVWIYMLTVILDKLSSLVPFSNA